MSRSCYRMVGVAFLLAGAAHASTREATIDFIVGSPHGFHPTAGPAIGKALEEVKGDQAGYLPLLEARLDPRRLDAIDATDREQVKWIGNCAALLVNLGDDGRRVLAERLDELTASRDLLQAKIEPLLAEFRAQPGGDIRPARELQDRIEAHMAIEQSIVRNLASVRDGRVADRLLARLDRDVDLQLVYVEYLAAVATERPDVRVALAKLSQTTPRPEVRRLIDALGRAPKK